MLKLLFPQKRYYLDYAASTPVSKQVQLAMKPYWTDNFANPSSIHSAGKKVKLVVDQCEVRIKKITHASKNTKTVWTSGGTESNRLAIAAAIDAWKTHNPGEKFVVLSSKIEHASVGVFLDSHNEPLMEVEYVDLESDGQLDLDHLKNLLEKNKNVALVVVQLQSSEVGVTQNIKKIGEVVKVTSGQFPLLHVDASQGLFYSALNMQAWQTDTLTLCAQKIHGPKGSGVLLCGKSLGVNREGTKAVGLIAGLTQAVDDAQKNIPANAKQISSLRKLLCDELRASNINFVCNGKEEVDSLVFNISFPDDKRDSEQLIVAFDHAGLEVSSKSACMGSQAENSQVLSVMGLQRNNSIRISLHHDLTVRDIKRVAKIITQVVD